MWSRTSVHAPREPPRALALGFWLATRGALVVTALIVAALGALAAAAYALVADHGAVTHLPTTAALGIAWSAGVMLAFGGALRAIARDWEEGVIALARARGVRAAVYVRGRVGGLVAFLGLALVGATLIPSLAALSTASAPLATAHDALAAMAYALAFAVTLGPVAMAALGARSRAGGYLTMLTVLVLPELVAPWTAELLPHGWHELTSISAALAAVMTGVLAPKAAGMSMIRAVVGLSAVVAISLAIVRTRIPRVSHAPNGDAR